MRELVALVSERELAWPGMLRMALRAPLLQAAAPGQYLLAGPRTRRDAFLPRALLPAQQDLGSEQVAVFCPIDSAQSGWLVGEEVRVVGPSGHGYEVDGKTRRALLLGAGPGCGPLLLLATGLVRRGLEVTFAGLADSGVQSMPGSLLPPEVEYLSLPVQQAGRQTASTLFGGNDDLLLWADQLFVAVPEKQLPSVLDAMRRRLLRLRKGFAQALVLPDLLPCGVGACDLCVLRMRDGQRRPCRDGLVFDLLTLL